MIQKIIDAAKAITPPTDDKDSQAWRWNVFWMLLILSITLGSHLGAAHGLLQPLGIQPFASAEEIKIIDERSKAILRAIYSPQIRAKVRKRCDTNAAGEREQINKELDRILAEYKAAAGEPFRPIPHCSEV